MSLLTEERVDPAVLWWASFKGLPLKSHTVLALQIIETLCKKFLNFEAGIVVLDKTPQDKKLS